MKKRPVIRDTFIPKKPTCITRQPLFSKQLLCLPVNGLPPLVLPHSYLHLRCYISMDCLTAFDFSYLYGALVCRRLVSIFLVHLSYISLVIRPAKEPRRVERKALHPITE